MKSVEAGMRISMAALVLGGCACVEPKREQKPINSPEAQSVEIFIPTPTEAIDVVVSQIREVPIQRDPDIESTIVEPNVEPEIKIFPLNATARYKRFASVEIDENGKRIFNRLTPGDPSFGVSLTDLPTFGKIWTAENYTQTILWFNILESARYQADGSNTFCNIFVWDATRALGVEIPHYVDGSETDANWIYDWITGSGEASGIPSWKWGKGSDFGWFEVTADEAQENANLGYPTVAVLADPKAYLHGHVAMVIPGEAININEVFYPQVAQVGSVSYIGLSAYDAFKPWLTGAITGESKKPKYFSIKKQYLLTHNGDGFYSTP